MKDVAEQRGTEWALHQAAGKQLAYKRVERRSPLPGTRRDGSGHGDRQNG
jgi:hypothetical protein